MVEKEVLDCMNDILKKVVKKEEKRLYDKEYRKKNKEKIKQYNKEHHKEHYEKNKEKILQQKKEYNQTEQGIKSRRINDWKRYGLICDNYDALYEHYLKTAYCDACKVQLTTDKENTATTKCMDHCHETGLFRNILCVSCNSKRKQDNL